MPIAPSVTLEDGVMIFHRDLVNLYGCHVGAATKIGAFVEIQKGAVIGQRCKISSHSFVCEGVTIEDDVFVGHGVMFINDPYPRATADGRLQTEADWTVVPTRVCKGASIGSGQPSCDARSPRKRSTAWIDTALSTRCRLQLVSHGW